MRLAMEALFWVVVILAIFAPIVVATEKAAKTFILFFCCLLGLFVVRLVNAFRRRRKVQHWNRQAIQVNDSLYELHRPEGVPTVQVLFFHGLPFEGFSEAHLSPHLSPWISGNESCIWPKVWLAEKFPNAHILLVSYIEGLRQDPAENFDMRIISENLTNDLIQANIGQTPSCPVVLVGHSFGGLVIKQLCLEAQQTRFDKAGVQKFLDNLRGVFYYSTPHHGLAHIERAISNLSGPLFKYFTTLGTEAGRLNYDFDHFRKSHPRLQIEGLGETLPVETGIFQGIVIVPEASARDGGNFTLESADHFSVSRPEKTTSRRFNALTTLLSNVCNNVKEEKAMAQKKDIQQNVQHLPKQMVNLDGLLEEVKSLLKESTTLGFVGMGGLGKTTLAMAVFNELSPTYEYSCFVPNLTSIGGDVEEVKKVVWKHMHHLGRKAEDKDEWSALIGKRLLIVLDDVSDDRDITLLSQLVDNSSPQSHFIVTSRDWILLSSLDCTYEVPLLDQKNSEKLFLSHALPNQAILPPNLQSDMVAIVEKCGGLPLTLAVLGSYLKPKRDGKFWKETLQALEKAEAIQDLEKRLWAKLRVSYDGLDEVAKQMFLDATTFFGKRKYVWPESSMSLRDAKAAWRAAYGTECETLVWQTLVDRSLVYHVDEFESIKVHDQLLSLGQKLASESSEKGKCRAWENKMASRLLNQELENQDIHALRFFCERDGHHRKPIHISSHALHKLRKLQYLEVDGPVIIDGVEEKKSFPSKLTLLKCFGRLETFDLALQDRLVVLHLSGVKVLTSSIEQLSALRVFIGTDLQILQDEFGNLSQLEYLEFRDCPSLTSLPATFGQLSRLERLIFDCCDGLYCLPETFGNLSQLKYLAFQSCYSLQSLPETFGNLLHLKYLHFLDCNIQILPDTFGGLCNLEELQFYNCPGLRSLPRSFCHLSALSLLHLRRCDNLIELPSSFGNLSTLDTLFLHRCNVLLALPSSFGNLSALTHLKISHCDQLDALPDSLGNLSALKHLKIGYCDQLNGLPDSFGDLFALEHLKFEKCQFEALPRSFAKLSTLRHLGLEDCGNVISMIPFGQLTQLQYLKINGSKSQIKKLPESLVELTALRHLVLDSVSIRSIPDFLKSIQSLHTLELTMLPYVKHLPAWLGETGVAPLALSRKVFQKQDGHFSFISEEPEIEHLEGLIKRIHKNAMEKLRELDYEGALADLCPANLIVLEPKLERFLLQERGIVRRFTGDLQGALKDLTASLEVLSDADDGHEYMYDCWKHRGYVNFILGDLDGAKIDGAMALKLLPEYNYSKVVSSPSLGERSVSYMHFKLVRRRREIDELWETIDLLHPQMMEKVKVSDFHGARAGWDVIDASTYGSNCRAFFLQERGILKRLAGDLHGALEDLTAALKICVEERDLEKDVVEDVEDIEDFKRISVKVVAYNCWKHRGFVKFLLRDLDGARKDGARASVLLACHNNGFSKKQMSPSLGEELVTYLHFNLHPTRDLDKQTTLQLHLHFQAMEIVRMSDFSGALTVWEDLDATASGYFDRVFFLQERGVLKRLAGDLQGALDDLTAALEILSEEDYKCCEHGCRHQHAYNCQKQRGYVNFLLGDLGGAQDNGAKALKLLCGDYKDNWEISPSLGGESITFMEFRLLGKREADGQHELMSPVHSRVMEKVSTSDFTGALAIWCTFDVSVLGYYDRGYFLQERGVLKQMAGNLLGALEDLTAALEIFDDDYELLKHRGYVKWLMGDEDGARRDAERCVAMKPAVGGVECLGGLPIAFLEFRLKGREENEDTLKKSSQKELMEKVKEKDFVGALAIWNDFDTRVSGYYSRWYFLQERGILKRMAGDLDGALEDLTAAMEWKKEEDYDHFKHRGYVKYLMGDHDGALVDAQRCMTLSSEGRDDYLGGFPVAFLGFDLK